MKRYIFLSALILSALFGVLYRQELFLKVIEWQVNSYFKQNFGRPLHYESIAFDEEGVVIQKPHLSKTGSKKELGFAADSISINYQIYFKKRLLDLQVVIENPEVSPERISYNIIPQLVSKNRSHFSILKIHTTLSVLDGTLVFPESEHINPAHFQLQADAGEFTHVNATANFGENAGNTLTLDFNRQKDATKILLDFRNTGCAAISHLAKLFLPEMSFCHMTKGSINGKLEFILPKNYRSFAQGQIEVQHIIFDHPALPLKGVIGKAHLHLEAPIVMLPSNNKAWRPIFKGSFEMADTSLKLYQGKNPLVDVNDAKGGIYFDEVNLAKIVLEGVYVSKKGPSAVHLTGDLHLPEIEAPSLDLSLKMDHLPLSIFASIQPLNDSINITGKVDLHSIHHEIIPAIEFGMDLERTPENLSKYWSLSSDAQEYWQNFGTKTLVAILPSFAAPLAKLEQIWLKQQLGFKGLMIKNGWFSVVGLPLNQIEGYANESFKISKIEGTADIKGVFNLVEAAVKYTLNHAMIETADAKIDMKEPVQASHFFNIGNGTHFGLISVKDAEYVNSHYQVPFTSVKADIHLKNRSAYISDIEGFSDGVYFLGNADVDYSALSKDAFEILLKAQTIHGSVAQFQAMLSRIDPQAFFLNIPMKGEISSTNGASMYIKRDDRGTAITTQIEGTLTDGASLGRHGNISLQDLSLNFAYRQKSNTLNISDIQGTVLVGKSDVIEEYMIAGDHLNFSDYANHQCTFDLWVGDKNRDIIRMAGKTEPQQDDSGCFAFIFDPKLTHFGDVHLETSRLVLKDWSSIKDLHFIFNFRLNTLLNDLKRFSRTGLFFLSPKILNELQDLRQASGDISFEMDYNDKSTLFTYKGTGIDVHINDSLFKEVLLNGKKLDDTWVVDQLQLDDISLSADVLKTNSLWKVNFLGLRYKDIVLLGMQGTYSPEQNQLKGQLNLIEVDLARLHPWNVLQDFVKIPNEKGSLKATGSITVDFIKGLQKWKLVTDLHLTDLKELHVEYEPSNFQISAVIPYKEKFYHFMGKSSSPLMLTGDLSIKDKQDVLSTIHWKHDGENKNRMTIAEGKLFGADVNLEYNVESGKGKVKFQYEHSQNEKGLAANVAQDIGLDAKAFVPVTGTVNYEIKDKKMYLTDFQDVYSENKISKFYLGKKSYQSYIDFDGTLHLRLRLKPSNLILKMKDLHVAIDGDVLSPSFSFQK